MKTYKALIIDDEPTARKILEIHLAKIDAIEVVGSCKNAIESFSYLNSQPIDLVFLDINMPELSGLSFAKTLKSEVKIIFTTAHREYAVDGFELKAVDYLPKPISLERLIQAVNKFMAEQPHDEKYNHVRANDFLFVRADRKMVKVNFEEILYIESLGDYVKINTTAKVVATRDTISNIAARLPTSLFVRCHRSYILAIASITAYTNEYIEIQDKMIPISRSYRKEVVQRLESL